MAFSSISKMTVPGSDGGAPEGLLMPKLQYRFRVLFDNFGVSQPTTELTKQVMDVTRPNVSFPEIPIEMYNSRIYLAGKPTWELLKITILMKLLKVQLSWMGWMMLLLVWLKSLVMDVGCFTLQKK